MPKGHKGFLPDDPNINRKGRPLSPDKAFEKVVDLLEDLQFHPAKELVRMYRVTRDEKIKAQILFKLLSYVEGKKADAKDSKAPTKPETPEESKRNAEKQAELIKKLEADAQKKPE